MSSPEARGNLAGVIFITQTIQKQSRHHREEDRGAICRLNKAGKYQSKIIQTIGFSQGSASEESATCKNEIIVK
jgi:hypothetical protein